MNINKEKLEEIDGLIESLWCAYRYALDRCDLNEIDYDRIKELRERKREIQTYIKNLKMKTRKFDDVLKACFACEHESNCHVEKLSECNFKTKDYVAVFKDLSVQDFSEIKKEINKNG